MRTATSSTSPGIVRFVLSAALDPSDELHRSCHQQILRRLEYSPDITVEDAEQQAMLLSSLAGSIGALSDERHLYIIRAALSLIDVWIDRCPASLSVQALGCVASFLSHLTFISPGRFYGCSLLRLVRLHLTLLSSSTCQLSVESEEESFHDPPTGVPDSIHLSWHRKACVLKDAASALLRGVPLALDEAMAIMTNCIDRVADGSGPTSPLSDIEAQSNLEASEFKLHRPHPPLFTLSRVFKLPFLMEFVESKPSFTTFAEAEKGCKSRRQVDANRLYLLLSILSSWGDEDPKLQAPILSALTNQVVRLEILFATEEQDRVQHRSGAEGEAAEKIDGLPEWAERAMQCVGLVEVESPGVGISVEGFGRLLKGLGRVMKAETQGAAGEGVSQEKDGVGGNSTRIEMATWLAVALSCAKRWCRGKKWKRMKRVPRDTGSAQHTGSSAGHGALLAEGLSELSERWASSGGKRQRRDEMRHPNKIQLVLNPQFYRSRARHALVSVFAAGLPLQGMHASQTLLVWGLGAQPGSLTCRQVVNDWILTAVRDPQTPTSTCHLALKITAALLGWDFGRPAKSTDDEAVMMRVGGAKEEEVVEGRASIGSSRCGGERNTIRRRKLSRKVWEAVKRRAGEETQEMGEGGEVGKVSREGLEGVQSEDGHEEVEEGMPEEAIREGTGVGFRDLDSEESEGVEKQVVDAVPPDHGATQAAEGVRRSRRQCPSRCLALEEAEERGGRGAEGDSEGQESVDLGGGWVGGAKGLDVEDCGASAAWEEVGGGSVASDGDQDPMVDGQGGGEERDWAEVGGDLLNLVLQGRGSRTLLAAAGVCRRWRETAVRDELWGAVYARRFTKLPQERPRHYKHYKWGMPWMNAFIWRLLFKNGALACKFCGQPFSKKAKTSLERHHANHIRRNALAYECPMQGCDSRYRSAKYVKRHLSTREEKAGHGLKDLSPYTCPLCPTEVLGKEQMRQHKRGHVNYN